MISSVFLFGVIAVIFFIPLGIIGKWFLNLFVFGRYPDSVFENPKYTLDSTSVLKDNHDASSSTQPQQTSSFSTTEVDSISPKEVKKKKITKNIFSQNSLNDVKDIDAIIIGSGIGGLACGAILSKAGKKVIVLEQNKTAGGSLHTFKRGGFPFEAGIHYIGNFEEGGALKVLLDTLCDKKIEMDELCSEYDDVVIYDTSKNQLLKRIEIPKGKKNYVNCLKNAFPEEKQAIDKYMQQYEETAKTLNDYRVPYLFLKLLPVWIAKLAAPVLCAPYFKLVNTTVKSVLESCTKNKTLQSCLAYFYGDYGMQPKECPFNVHYSVQSHYMEGAYFPKKGAVDIVESLIKVIRKSGGDVFTKAKVASIIIKNGKATGVQMSNGVIAQAKTVISNAGLYNTFKNLITESDQTKYNLRNQIDNYRPSQQLNCVFIGYDKSAEELGLRYQNCWLSTSDDLDGQRERYIHTEDGSIDPKQGIDIPDLLFSIKPQKNNTYITCCFETKYEWFKEWEHQRCKKRGAGYLEIKQQLTERALELLHIAYPQLKIFTPDVLDSSTPLTCQHYLACPFGEAYGRKMDADYFTNLEVGRPETPIEGLYLTGQDIFSLGVAGALASSLLTTTTLLHRNMFGDWFAAVSKERKRIKESKKAQ
ncbi:hypothetical protein FDP41_013366 [Naegleria fowleri]|uniref:Amine oxidase domain-containing protein n=1 Tax=Naegleria fowleri TaxID=5763 RepID=A0A6A5C051_NAEFO|nr:uncharacterized protein FDP41_013366 [Naegleria fowleri]KAF0980152.1 hypothetical protein FDP41_013366 [Naegleria fowleri]CAG4718059.1 unnamed protein product [Naegleria fowleri]